MYRIKNNKYFDIKKNNFLLLLIVYTNEGLLPYSS